MSLVVLAVTVGVELGLFVLASTRSLGRGA